ncbi:MAG: methylenetetrahydrofolate reductase C-terminal domain-containing protein [Solirubrobacterales bacterium]|nr:methylenetetrahydrofolate reductase C-terminal domain-containing protein [Solirubrobacterales bacterium]MBV9717582.1 methylenetetrahydrofolate reductase C-terminal domain-containing protein [Solirubrobacterales bacterium]
MSSAPAPGAQAPERGSQKPLFRDCLAEPGSFSIAVELVTSRGLVTAASSRASVEMARELAADPRIDVLSITDNPGGHAMLAPDTLGTDLVSRGQEVIIHLACKDWNRNALESRGWKLASEGFHNVLALSGDYPLEGVRGAPAPVFDIDSVGLLKLFSDMNGGLRDFRKPERRLEHTDFFLGCVVTNHKRHEREVVPQYLKLAKKTRAGARFVINQIGYNVAKDDELLRYIRHAGLSLRVLANVYLLSRPAARAFNAGRIPGVVVTDELLAVAERYGAGEDKGRAFFIDLAAKQAAVARALGFDGVYLGGHATAPTFHEIIERSRDYADDWQTAAKDLLYAHPDEFYMFERDSDTGLSSDRLSQAYLESKRRRQTDLPVPARYRVSRHMHRLLFDPEAPLFPAGRALYKRIEEAGPAAGRAAHLAEQAAKIPMFHCRDCGDCSLPDIAYVCPESMCAKNQRNGPCGGTRDGLCEVYDTECIWSQAYERLKAYGESDDMLDGPVVVKDNGLDRTSAWANTFLGRDHNTRDGAQNTDAG